MRVIIKENYDEMSKRAAQIVAEQIRLKPDCVLGLATGSTPLGLYKELIRLHREEGLDFSKVITFNLDEYIGLPPEHPQSYHYFMYQNFFNHLNIDPRFIYIPHGMTQDVERFCNWYEKEIERFGGIDLQILGIGANGHIGFNEPGSSLGSRTRIKTLTKKTIEDNARFFEKMEDVPKYAITMGIGTIMDAKKQLLLASGKNKAKAISQAIEGPISQVVPASILQLHRWVTVVLDKDAASMLKMEYFEE